MKPAIVWFRQDLRLEDNPALRAAAAGGRPVVPAFILAPEEAGAWPRGAASRWWLHRSLAALAESLEARGSRLVLRRGQSLEALRSLVEKTGAGAVFWNRAYEPAAARRDAEVARGLEAHGVRAESWNGQLLYEPWEVEKKSGGPYKVFTRFWHACLSREAPAQPARAPRTLRPPREWPASETLAALGLVSPGDRFAAMQGVWVPGEAGARKRLRRFVQRALSQYGEDRNRPDLPGSSRLSPHLHFGEVSPRRVWWDVEKRRRAGGFDSSHAETYRAEIGWREFAYHLLHHFPSTPEKPLRPEFARFPWRKDARRLEAWQSGHTGVPLVDAGMRELGSIGWMHNRVRMVVASFLVKHLLIPWQEGARWFWDALVDADLASNTLGWQWTAGCGADAAPYFRVFNPVLQGERFDPRGDYVRRWIPELEKLPDRWVHHPWEAPAAVLQEAGVTLGRTYPRPIVELTVARDRALAAYSTMKKRS